MNKEIIAVKQLPIIEEKLQIIKTDVTARVEKAVSLACTPETVKTVKEARANLNKEFKEWEDKRKQVKKLVLEPYEQFETIYKDCITDVFRNADKDLKEKVDTIESDLKMQKASEVMAYFEEYRASKDIDFITFGHAKINVTLSASMKSLKEQAKAFIDRVCDDLALIETQEHKDEILYEYKQNLNVSASITTVSNRYKAIEEAKTKEEERKTKEQAMTKAAEKVEEALAPPTVEEKTLTVAFKVTATMSKLRELKEFLNNGGYDYE